MKKIRCRLMLFFIVIGLFICILTSGLSQTSVNFAFAHTLTFQKQSLIF